MNRKHYESLISYHESLLKEAQKLNNIEAAAFQRGMIEAYRRVLNTSS